MRKTGRWLLLLTVLAAAPAWAEESMSQLKGIGYGSPETFAEFHGFADLVYSDFQKGGDNGGNASFQMGQLYLTTLAKITKNLTVFGEIEYEQGGAEIKVDRAFIDWEISRAVQFRLGKFYTPFGVEIREYQAPLLKLVTRPLYVETLTFGEWTDSGINAYGSLGPQKFQIYYDVAVVNGPNGLQGDMNRQDFDNNNNKTVAGRVNVLFQGVEVGTSYASGKYDAAGQRSFNLWGADAKFRMGGLDLRGEYVQRGGDNDPNFVPPAAAPIGAKASGYYVQASYGIHFDRPDLYLIEPIVRYDGVNPDKNVKDNSDQTRVSLGIRYMPFPHYAIKAEYDIVQEKHGPSIDNNGILFQAVADF